MSPNHLDLCSPTRPQRQKKLFIVHSNFVSATEIFESVDHDTLCKQQTKEYGEYVKYILDDDAPLPRLETATTMSYYSIQNGLLFKSYLPRHFRKRSQFHDQLVLPKDLTGLVMHAYHDHALSGGHLANRPTYAKFGRNTGGRLWHEIFAIGVANAKRANDGKHHTDDLNSKQGTYRFNDHLRRYQWT